MLLKLLFETRVAHDMRRALLKIIMVEVSRHLQSQIFRDTSLLPQWLWSPKLEMVITYNNGLPPIKSHDSLITWSCEITRQIRSLFFHYQSAFDQQNRRDDNLPGWDLTHKVTWPFYHVIFRYNVAKRNHYISTTIMHIATKLGSIMRLLLEGLLTIKSYNSLITWFCEIQWQTKNIVFPILQCLVPSATKLSRMVT